MYGSSRYYSDVPYTGYFSFLYSSFRNWKNPGHCCFISLFPIADFAKHLHRRAFFRQHTFRSWIWYGDDLYRKNFYGGITLSFTNYYGGYSYVYRLSNWLGCAGCLHWRRRIRRLYF